MIIYHRILKRFVSVDSANVVGKTRGVRTKQGIIIAYSKRRRRRKGAEVREKGERGFVRAMVETRNAGKLSGWEDARVSVELSSATPSFYADLPETADSFGINAARTNVSRFFC